MEVDSLDLIGISGFPRIDSISDLVKEIVQALTKEDIELQNMDILILAHTIVSKWEGRIVKTSSVSISQKASEIAERNGFDPVHVELALRESKEIIREDRTLITETHSGLVCNFSGVDKSNAPEGHFILLPKNPDKSAEIIRMQLKEQVRKDIAVIITDTQGRPWRKGSINIAIGCAGINAYKHNRGKRDLYGRELQRSMVCQIDEIASAAENIMGQADEGIPIVILRGYKYEDGPERAKDVIRPKDEDLFR